VRKLDRIAASERRSWLASPLENAQAELAGAERLETAGRKRRKGSAGVLVGEFVYRAAEEGSCRVERRRHSSAEGKKGTIRTLHLLLRLVELSSRTTLSKV
jgi:hypothetical protein